MTSCSLLDDAGSADSVISVNLLAPRALVNGLLEKGALAEGGAVIDVSSIAGIAGQPRPDQLRRLQGGVIGLIDAYAPILAEKGVTINAVAPASSRPR